MPVKKSLQMGFQLLQVDVKSKVMHRVQFIYYTAQINTDSEVIFKDLSEKNFIKYSELFERKNPIQHDDREGTFC